MYSFLFRQEDGVGPSNTSQDTSPSSPSLQIITNARGRSIETRLGGALRYWRRIVNGVCDTARPTGAGSGSCPIIRRRGGCAGRRGGEGFRIETHQEDAGRLISHAGFGAKRSTYCTAPAVGVPLSSDETEHDERKVRRLTSARGWQGGRAGDEDLLWRGLTQRI